jgi:hypothetical protein
MADTTTVSNITQEVPSWYRPYLEEAMARARGVANQQYQPYGGARIQPFTQDQNTSFNTVRGMQGAWNPYAQTASSQLDQAGGLPSSLGLAEGYYGNAMGIAGQDTVGGYLGQGTNDINQATGISGLGSASPWMSAASQSFPGSVDQYMSPYTDKVLDVIAQRGARNLSENLLPAVGDTFMGHGQFGSERQRDFTNRAVRDTQEGILDQQAKSLESGYATAGNLFNQDANRYAGLASTAGGLAGADASRLLGASQARTGLANTALSQTGQGINTSLAAGQGMLGAQNQGYNQLTGLAGQNFQLGQGIQGLGYTDAAALGAIGQQQQQLGQQSLNTAYQDFLEQRNYPMDMTSYFSNIIRGYNPGSNTAQQSTTTAPDPSTVSQIAGLGTGLLGIAGATGMFRKAGGRIQRRDPKPPNDRSSEWDVPWTVDDINRWQKDDLGPMPDAHGRIDYEHQNEYDRRRGRLPPQDDSWNDYRDNTRKRKGYAQGGSIRRGLPKQAPVQRGGQRGPRGRGFPAAMTASTALG